MKIPWTSKSVLGSVAGTVGAAVEDLELADLDDRPLPVLDAPGTTAFAVVVIAQRLPIPVLPSPRTA